MLTRQPRTHHPRKHRQRSKRNSRRRNRCSSTRRRTDWQRTDMAHTQHCQHRRHHQHSSRWLCRRHCRLLRQQCTKHPGKHHQPGHSDRLQRRKPNGPPHRNLHQHARHQPDRRRRPRHRPRLHSRRRSKRQTLLLPQWRPVCHLILSDTGRRCISRTLRNKPARLRARQHELRRHTNRRQCHLQQLQRRKHTATSYIRGRRLLLHRMRHLQ